MISNGLFVSLFQLLLTTRWRALSLKCDVHCSSSTQTRFYSSDFEMLISRMRSLTWQKSIFLPHELAIVSDSDGWIML